MNLKPLGNNVTELSLKDGIKVLFSYSTPVAVRALTPSGMEYYVTDVFYSRTTIKHINDWIPKEDRIEKPQTWFNELVGMTHNKGDK